MRLGVYFLLFFQLRICCCDSTLLWKGFQDIQSSTRLNVDVHSHIPKSSLASLALGCAQVCLRTEAIIPLFSWKLQLVISSLQLMHLSRFVDLKIFLSSLIFCSFTINHLSSDFFSFISLDTRSGYFFLSFSKQFVSYFASLPLPHMS